MGGWREREAVKARQRVEDFLMLDMFLQFISDFDYDLILEFNLVPLWKASDFSAYAVYHCFKGEFPFHFLVLIQCQILSIRAIHLRKYNTTRHWPVRVKSCICFETFLKHLKHVVAEELNT